MISSADKFNFHSFLENLACEVQFGPYNYPDMPYPFWAKNPDGEIVFYDVVDGFHPFWLPLPGPTSRDADQWDLKTRKRDDVIDLDP